MLNFVIYLRMYYITSGGTDTSQGKIGFLDPIDREGCCWFESFGKNWLLFFLVCASFIRFFSSSDQSFCVSRDLFLSLSALA